jgi:hypothetical protein
MSKKKKKKLSQFSILSFNFFQFHRSNKFFLLNPIKISKISIYIYKIKVLIFLQIPLNSDQYLKLHIFFFLKKKKKKKRIF